MDSWICVTCGSQFAPSGAAPPRCPICDDERQYVPPAGQRWVTLAELRSKHGGDVRELEPDLYGIGETPGFAIGQRALLLRTPAGNVLWDCIPLLDDGIEGRVRDLGGLAAIAISHPHFYASMIEWSHRFGRVPVYLHAADRQWVMRPDPVIEHWEGESRAILPGVTMIRCGGHFPGSSVLHWDRGALPGPRRPKFRRGSYSTLTRSSTRTGRPLAKLLLAAIPVRIDQAPPRWSAARASGSGSPPTKMSRSMRASPPPWPPSLPMWKGI
jgi:hypothetical protein